LATQARREPEYCPAYFAVLRQFSASGSSAGDCHHQAPADLQALLDVGRGDQPLKDLKFRCANCGSRLTDAVVMGKCAVGVQPWRHEAG
jgi:hypothetical protein